MMQKDTCAVIPLLLVLMLLVIGLVVLFLAGILVCLAFKQVIALVLVASGVYLLIKPESLGGQSAIMRVLVPFALIGVGAAIVLGYLWVG